MRPFISLPKKIMLLLLALLISIAVSLSWLWLSKTNQDLLLKQQEIQQQNQSQYILLNDMNRNRLESWIELFVHINDDRQNQLQVLKNVISEKFELLQLNWQVENMWLTDSAGNMIFSSGESLPSSVQSVLSLVLEKQHSFVELSCAKQCQQILGIPILLNDGKTAVIAASVGMLETLAFLNQSTEATLALVHVPGDQATAKADSLFIRGPLSAGHETFIQNLIDDFPAEYQISKLLSEGIQVHQEGKEYLLNLIPMTVGSKDGNYILSAHNITPMILAHNAYQLGLLITASVVFIVSGLLFYLLTNSFRQRLIGLSERLPLLASRDYEKFQNTEQKQSHLFLDELDLLVDSSSALANQLQELDEQVEAKTDELQKIAMYDSLTKLPNRNMLLFQLKNAIFELRREPGLVVILFFDLDDFKKVNDSHGHGMGDSLLIEAASRLEKVLRKTDIACRFGGDEFVVLLNQLENIEGAIKVAEKLLKTFQQPIRVNNQRFYVSTSIGLTATMSSDLEAEDFIRQADIAMYQAKEAGGNCYKMYDVEMSQKALDKVALEVEARDALIDQQFTFALQPQIELSTGKLIGFEALLRWCHPERGEVSPNHFIPVLENTEFMLSLGYWCIERAFKLLEEFREKGYAELKIAINLAGIQFLDPNLIPFLEEKLVSSGIKAELIELELTERTLVSDIDRATNIMQKLIDLGFIISIDDFGTGYSSLSYLKRMPAHIIKIDRSFIAGMSSSNADKQIVSSTINMVQNLGMKVVAEGIEEQEQLALLREYNCDMVQGYFLARPIPEKDLYHALDTNLRDDIWHWDNSQ